MKTKIIRFQIDALLRRIRKSIKSGMPLQVRRRIDEFRYKNGQAVAAGRLLAGQEHPWMSPNIWVEIVGFYRKLESPVVHEYGTGASTIRHLDEMLSMKAAQYIGVENDPTWFWTVVAALMNRAFSFGRHVDVAIKTDSRPPGAQAETRQKVDVELRFGDVLFLLHLRTKEGEYVDALEMVCDVIIVDGIARKECIRKILASNHLRQGGMLMLMEAGRGSDQWWEGRLEDGSDYSDELGLMLALGGELLDGTGLDNWAGCRRRSPKPVSYYYPMEACRLISG